MKLLIPLFIGIILGPPAYGFEFESHHPSHYPYHLQEVHHSVVGVVGIDTARGERVRAVLEELVHEEGEGHEEGPAQTQYLQLTFRKNNRARPLLSTKKNTNIFMTTANTAVMTTKEVEEKTTAEKATTQHQVPFPTSAGLQQRETTQDSSDDEILDVSMATRTLAQTSGTQTNNAHAHSIHLTHLAHLAHLEPHKINIHKREVARAGHVRRAPRAANVDLEFNIEESSGFYVDPDDHYLKVYNLTELQEHTSVEFYVYLTNQDGEVVSNPLPFTVHIERPVVEESYPLGPAVFAGVLVLVICFLAFFIPFVTRAKRRYKQGKPIMKMGSHPSSVDLEKASMSRASSEPNWYGNNAYYSYEEEIQREKNEFSSGIKDYSEAPTLQLSKTKRSKETASMSGSSGIDVASQFAEGTTADEVVSQRL